MVPPTPRVHRSKVPCVQPHPGSLGLDQQVHAPDLGQFALLPFGKIPLLLRYLSGRETSLSPGYSSLPASDPQGDSGWGGVETRGQGQRWGQGGCATCLCSEGEKSLIIHLSLMGPGRRFSLDPGAPSCQPCSRGWGICHHTAERSRSC